jgi:DNA repair protein RadC
VSEKDERRAPDRDLRAVIASEGAVRLTDTELLALVLGTGSSGLGVLGIAGDTLSAAGGVSGLSDCSYRELYHIRGIGPAKAAAVISALELGRRAMAGAVPGARLSSSADVYSTFWPSMVSERVEVFTCAMVDAKLRLIRMEIISKGTLTASIVHPREAFRPAVRNAASGVIFVHNHPSGDPLPSDEDRRITGRLEEVGRILGIPLLDHVVVGAEGSYYSFADAGNLLPQSNGYRGMVLRQLHESPKGERR